MSNSYRTVRMARAPQVGEIFSSSLLDPTPAPDKWWKVMFSPVAMALGGFAVTLQECDPKPDKGPIGDHVHKLLRDKPPEPTMGMIYAEVLALRAMFEKLADELQQEVASIRAQVFGDAP